MTVKLTKREQEQLHKDAMKDLSKYGSVEAFEAAVSVRTYPANPSKGKKKETKGKKTGK